MHYFTLHFKDKKQQSKKITLLPHSDVFYIKYTFTISVITNNVSSINF